MGFRKEKDSLGVKKVPSKAYYGAFTARALENFELTNYRIQKEFIDSLAEIKVACAVANRDLKVLDKRKADAIVKAGKKVMVRGKFDDEFKLDVFMAGGGTPYNMNMNEVIANKANELLGGRKGTYNKVHPNDDVNHSQSSNDVVPTAIGMTSLKMNKHLLREIEELEKSLNKKAGEFWQVMKSGRTHLQDAVPVSLGMEFRSYSAVVKNARKRILSAQENLRGVPLGGNAVGTGINSHPRFAEKAVKELNKMTGLKLKNADNLMSKIGFASDFMEFANALSELSVDLNKICNDLMLLSSGPNTGLNEISLPEVEPGSSIMPGKINPSILEAFNMICFQVQGNRLAVEKAVSQGTLELNVYTPSIAFNLLSSISMLRYGINMLNVKCIKGIKANKEQALKYFNESASLATILNPVIGYAKAAELVKESARSKKNIQELIFEKGILSRKEMNLLIKSSLKPNMHIVKKMRKTTI